MTHEFDPDDNFANGAHASAEFDDDATAEALVWQLLLLINPGDEDTALQQFAAYQQAAADADPGDVDPASLLRDVIDWKSGFHIDEGDVAGCIDVLTELAARWNIVIDWGVDDPGDDDFLADADVTSLLATAFDRLREYGYTLWTREAGSDAHAGWLTLRQDDEAMQAVASALGIALRVGAG